MLNIIHCKFSSPKIKFMIDKAHNKLMVVEALYKRSSYNKLSTFRGELASTEATTVKITKMTKLH